MGMKLGCRKERAVRKGTALHLHRLSDMLVCDEPMICHQFRFKELPCAACVPISALDHLIPGTCCSYGTYDLEGFFWERFIFWAYKEKRVLPRE